eukprot:6197067-Pleurochrysis_carterae.AAC.1
MGWMPHSRQTFRLKSVQAFVQTNMIGRMQQPCILKEKLGAGWGSASRHEVQPVHWLYRSSSLSASHFREAASELSSPLAARIISRSQTQEAMTLQDAWHHALLAGSIAASSASIDDKRLRASSPRRSCVGRIGKVARCCTLCSRRFARYCHGCLDFSHDVGSCGLPEDPLLSLKISEKVLHEHSRTQRAYSLSSTAHARGSTKPTAWYPIPTGSVGLQLVAHAF